MKLLVTGGCGFIGSNFIRYMLNKHSDIEIVNLDKLTYCGNPANLKDIESDSRYSFIEGDICDEGLVNDVISGIHAVINFAAESHVDRSIKYPDDFLMTNVYGLKVLLEASKDAGVKRFIQIGTDEVYGSVSEGFSKEEDLLKPNSPYSSTKAAGDLLALSYYTTYGLPVIVTRSSNNFGPFQYPEKMISLFVTNLIRDDKVPLYGDGENVRDWLYVEDNCEAIDLVLAKGKPGEIYNIGGGDHFSNLQLTEKIFAAMDKGREYINFVNDRPGHDWRYALNSTKIGELGWAPRGDFQENLLKTIEWYRNNEWWWEPLKDTAEIIRW